MVDASELAFRSLVEEHGCDLGYTPMMHGALMGRDDKYRTWQIEENFKEELDARNSGAFVFKQPPSICRVLCLNLNYLDCALCVHRLHFDRTESPFMIRVGLWRSRSPWHGRYVDTSYLIRTQFYRSSLFSARMRRVFNRIEYMQPSRSSDVNLDVVDEAGRGFSDAELAVQLAKVGPRSAPRRGDDDGDEDGAASSDPSSAVDLSAAAECCPIYTVHRDVAFRYRTRRTRRVFSQFSGNIGTVVLAGARHVQSFCDAIDLKCDNRLVLPVCLTPAFAIISARGYIVLSCFPLYLLISNIFVNSSFGCPQDIARRVRESLKLVLLVMQPLIN